MVQTAKKKAADGPLRVRDRILRSVGGDVPDDSGKDGRDPRQRHGSYLPDIALYSIRSPDGSKKWYTPKKHTCLYIYIYVRIINI